VLALQYFTRTFQHIPQAALALLAVIFVAIYNLIAISDFWEVSLEALEEALSFITMIITCHMSHVTWVIVFVFVFDTAYGLAALLGLLSLICLMGVHHHHHRHSIILNSQNDDIQ
jgi:hypothetical protein